MQNFLKNDRVEQTKKPVLARIKNFEEIYEQFEVGHARNQSDRCVQCGIPYCRYGCPLSNYIPQWLKATTQKDLELAFKLSNESSPFPEIMGRVCPQDRLCEGNCTLNSGFGAITIGSVETFITEEGFKSGFTINYPTQKSSKKIAIIGAGPAGLSAATFLLRAGFNVSMYEKEAFGGGLLSWGIPDFKLNKKTVFNRIEMLKKAGMELYLGKEVGKDISFEEIQKSYDAVFLGFGAKKSNYANIEGEKLDNVILAIDFLGMAQSKTLTLPQFSAQDLKGKTVLVIGGGDTAMDCARTAIRDGAAKTICAYRRDEKNMPGSKKEYKNAIEEGVEFSFLMSPKKISSNGALKNVEFAQVEIVKSADAPRGKLQEVANSSKIIEADIVVLALGFEVSAPEFVKTANIELSKWGQVIVDKNQMTNIENVYAGGDCSRGANLVVNAALDGRTAARVIAKKLKDN